MSNYEVKTYGMTEVFLEANTYTLQQLKDLVQALEQRNARLKASCEPVSSENPRFQPQALTKEEADAAWEESKGAPDRLQAYRDLLDDKLWKKNKLRQYKEAP